MSSQLDNRTRLILARHRARTTHRPEPDSETESEDRSAPADPAVRQWTVPARYRLGDTPLGFAEGRPTGYLTMALIRSTKGR